MTTASSGIASSASRSANVFEAEFLADEGAHFSRRIVDANDLELPVQLEQIRNVLDLGDAARPDHSHPYALHRPAPSEPERFFLEPRLPLVPLLEPDSH